MTKDFADKRVITVDWSKKTSGSTNFVVYNQSLLLNGFV